MPNVPTVNLSNPHVFLDVTIGEEYVGRIILELYANRCPKTAENFRALCTGEMGIGKKGFPLHYTGSPFHRVIKQFMIQGGDFTAGNGSGGESIYGENFEDEAAGLEMKHDRAGLLSMANAGPNTNGSQFFITCVPTPHLDGKHVIFGHVVKGYPLVSFIENIRTQGECPVERCFISGSGQIDVSTGGTDIFGINCADGTEDVFPPFPEDGEDYINLRDYNTIVSIGEKIKASGNLYFKKEEFILAGSKYKKALRYLNKLHDDHEDGSAPTLSLEQEKRLLQLELNCLLNSAACKIKTKQYESALEDCEEALDISPDNPKAWFRKGQSLHGSRDYEKSLQSLIRAQKLAPHDKSIHSEIVAVKGEIQAYKALEKKAYAKFFS